MRSAITQFLFYFFLKFSSGNLLIILYQLSKFEAPSCNGFWDIKFSLSKIAQGNNEFFVFNFHQVVLIILYPLTKFEAPTCNSFWNILITKLHNDPLKGT